MSTLSFVKKIAKKSRYSGTSGEKDAYTLISTEFENLGCDVEKEETKYIKSEKYVVIMGLIFLWLTFFLFISPRFIHPLLVGVVIIGLFVFQTMVYPRIELKLAKSKSTNIIATINPDKENRLILCGHYDSARVMSAFIQKNRRILLNVAPFISLMMMLYIVLLFYRGFQLFLIDDLKIHSLYGLTNGMTGLWEFVWLFYSLLFGAILFPATYILLTYLTKKISYGADDNASGIAVMLEAARKLKDMDLNLRVDFACFAAEEKGLFGSGKWVNKHIEDLDKEKTYVLNLDCVGRGKKFFVNKGLGAVFKKSADPVLFNIVCSTCSELQYPYEEDWGGASDHSEFLKKKLKCCAVLRCDELKANVGHRILRKVFRIPIKSNVIGFMDWIHTEEDLIDHIDEEKLEETTNLVITVTERLNERINPSNRFSISENF